LEFPGLVLTSPFFTAQNMSVYPSYNDDDYGAYLVFQLGSSSAPYVTVPCEVSTSFPYDIIACGVSGSFNLPFSLSFSFSLIETLNHEPRNPDEMSFSLF